MEVLCDVWDASPEDEYVKKTNKDIIETIELEEKNGKYHLRDLLKVSNCPYPVSYVDLSTQG